MDYQLFLAIKKQTVIYNLLRKFHSKIRITPIYYFKTLILDPHHLKENLRWYKLIKQTQINKDTPLFLDRQNECNEFFSKTALDNLVYFLSQGFPNTNKFEKKLSKFFDSKTHTDKLLIKAYQHSAYHYSLRLMLAYERFSLITPFLGYLESNSTKPITKWSVIDYGCGVSDIGIFFANLGAKVTIVDLNDKKLDFAIWRYKKRGLKVKEVRIRKLNKYPNLEKKQDLIIATEVFEHVRNPLALLKEFRRSLKKGGILFDSMSGKFERDFDSKGDHLVEAQKIGTSTEFRNYHKKYFSKVKFINKPDFIFKKIR